MELEEIKIKSITDLKEYFSQEVFKLKNIMEGVVYYESLIPYQHGYYMFNIEVSIFYDNGNCLGYEKLEDILIENDMVYQVVFKHLDNENEIMFTKKYDEYGKS